MADSKTPYSSASRKYVSKTVSASSEAKHSYDVSKKKERIYGDSWKKVDLNEIVNTFTPNAKEYVKGYKYIFEGTNYYVIADMVSGSARIVDKNTNQPLKLNGKPGSRNETHFKIKKKGE